MRWLRRKILRPLRDRLRYRDTLPLLRLAEHRLQRAGAAQLAALAQVQTPEEWWTLRLSRLSKLRDALGLKEEPLTPGEWERTARIDREGIVIEAIRYPSRNDSWVTAHLYRPTTDPNGPGVVVAHGHHAPKDHVELQSLAGELARAGCKALIPDLPGHGERSVKIGDWRGDYYRRHALGAFCELHGQSLAGWMVEDLIRSVGVLLALPEVDSARIAIIGAVAGGGDLAAMTAALDERIACAVPFNYGGLMQRPDADPTRCPRRAAVDGFVPWATLAAIAPRPLIYAHEFAWTAGGDPGWAPLRRVFDLLDAPEKLAAMHGDGKVSGRPPANTHCVEIGNIHRRRLYPLLSRVLDISIEAEEDRPLFVDDLNLDRTSLGVVRGTSSHARLRQTPEPWPGIAALRSSNLRHIDVPGEARLRISLAGPTSSLAPLVLIASRRPAAEIRRRETAAVDRLTDSGVAVAILGLRGSGDSGSAEDRHDRLAPATRLAHAERMLGRSPLGLAIRDLLTVLSLLRRDKRRILLWGEGEAPGARYDDPLPAGAVLHTALGELDRGATDLAGLVLGGVPHHGTASSARTTSTSP